MVDLNGFLMIEPKDPDHAPVIDSATRKVATLLRSAAEGTHWRGWHTCVCGASSGTCDLVVFVGGKTRITNSLAVHYVACHREEIPAEQMKFIEELSESTKQPTAKELAVPTEEMRERVRRWAREAAQRHTK